MDEPVYPEVPRWLEEAVEQALERRDAARPGSAEYRMACKSIAYLRQCEFGQPVLEDHDEWFDAQD